MSRPVRRVVTGHSPDGRAVVVEDGPPPVVRTDPKRPGYAMTQLWMTDTSPTVVDNGPDPTRRPITLAPPANGTVVRIIEFPPSALELRDADPATAAEAFAMFNQAKALTGKSGTPPRHPFMHRTETVDYAVVLSGEIVMLLDDSEVALAAGDVVIQRGTHHAWTNRSDHPCRMMFVLVDGRFDTAIEAAIASHDSGGAADRPAGH